MNEGFLLKLIFRKAMGDTNEAYYDAKKSWTKIFSDKKILKTIWDRMDYDNPVAPFTDYFNTIDEK